MVRQLDVVATPEQAARLERSPLIVIEPLEAFLDAAGLGSGRLVPTPIGAGHSNVTYALDRGRERFVLRRPPRGPLPASAHDVLREARLLRALAGRGARVPEVLAVCDRPDVIGAPFYVMTFIDGHVLEHDLPSAFAAIGDPQRIADELVDALVELHAVDVSTDELAAFGKPSGYLDRQLRRFHDLLERSATRPLPDLELAGEWLAATRPDTGGSTVVHGDYRLGNSIFGPQRPPRIVALLDWEMATVGDPLADVGYLTAMWADASDSADPMLDLCRVTRRPGFPSRQQLAARYASLTGRDVSSLRWYQALALWKAAIFLEGSYRRFLAGTTHDPYFAHLEDGVPRLARRAVRHAQS
jgi:aminoglycoside phosphotransferase (APT) family kinase protein